MEWEKFGNKNKVTRYDTGHCFLTSPKRHSWPLNRYSCLAMRDVSR